MAAFFARVVVESCTAHMVALYTFHTVEMCSLDTRASVPLPAATRVVGLTDSGGTAEFAGQTAGPGRISTEDAPVAMGDSAKKVGGMAGERTESGRAGKFVRTVGWWRTLRTELA